MKHFLFAAAAAALVAAPAAAVTVSSIAAAGGNTVTVITEAPGLLEVDFGISQASPIVLGLAVGDGDANGIDFNSVIDSFLGVTTGQVLTSLSLSLSNGATFSFVGSVVPAFSTATFDLSADGSLFSISFGSEGESFGLTLGAIDGLGKNFVILPGGGDFTLTLDPTGAFLAVPEPAAWGLMIAGFGLTGFAMRRRGATPVIAA